MTRNVYEKLAEHLARLPAGYPRTASGVELRILRRLFTQEDAALALHLTLIPEKARIIAYRAGITLETAMQRLEEMDEKGLIFSNPDSRGKLKYSIQQFIVGFWEGQVNKLTPELVMDFEEYLPAYIDLDLWEKVPQLRTIPVGKSIETRTDVMPYEQAEKLVCLQETISVNSCICRQEQQILGNGCKKPRESCLIFGPGAEHNIRIHGGRAITREEALSILVRAEKAGLVLQTSNARESHFICTCCGCCCGALRSYKQDPEPASRISTPFRISLDTGTCTGCRICLDRCQMDALQVVNDAARVDPGRCIGCGLCVSTCPTASLSLERKPVPEQPHVPGTLTSTYIKLGRVSGRTGIPSLIGMKWKSVRDRLLAHGH